MALAKALLDELNNEENPLSKRLHIAQKAFISSEIVFQNKEVILLSWAIQNIKSKNANELWDTISRWVKFEQFDSLNRSTTNNQSIESLIQVLNEKLKYIKHVTNVKENVIETICTLLNNRVFHQYFKYNVEKYCVFMSNVLCNLSSKDDALQLIVNEQIFPKTLICEEDFQNYFLQHNLQQLSSVLKSFNYDEELFSKLSQLLCKCMYLKNIKTFEVAFRQIFGQETVAEKQRLPKNLFKFLGTCYESEDDAKYSFKLLYHSFCNACGKKYELMFQFFIVLLEIIGFDSSKSFTLKKISKYKVAGPELHKSIEILFEVIQVLTEHSDIATQEVCNISFTDVLVNISNSLMCLTQIPTVHCYKILMDVFTINPLIIETIIHHVLIYAMLADNTEHDLEYKILLVTIFGIYAKLHRIENLISKMIPSIKSAINGETTIKGPYKFSGNIDVVEKKLEYFSKILPESVLGYFSQCITNLASWQVFNIFKTLIFHLKSVVNDLPNYKDESYKLMYVELITTLMCYLLVSVRIAEHTVPDTVVKKFLRGMDELKDVQKDFGVTLLNLEYNNIIMKSFLDISFTWAELYMMISYYSDGEIEIQRVTDANDTSACNLSYLHSYLTTKQWGLISERITNFGDASSKLIMHKLFVQKLRAMLIFENKVSEELKVPVAKVLCNNLEDNWEIIIADKYIINHLTSYFSPSHIFYVANCLVEDMLSDNRWDVVNRSYLIEHQPLGHAMMLSLFTNINNQIKSKKKQDNKSIQCEALSSKVFLKIESDAFIPASSELDDVFTDVKQLIHGELLNEDTNGDSQVDVGVILQNLGALQKLPVIFYTPKIQSIVTFYMLSLHKDCSFIADSSSLKERLESIIIGIFQQNEVDYSETFVPEIITQYFALHFARSNYVFTIYVENLIKKEKHVTSFKTGVEFLAENVKEKEYLSFTVILLHTFNKWKKNKMSITIKETTNEYSTLIQKKLLKLITKREPESHLIEAYAFLLKIALSKSEDKPLAKLKPLLTSYIDIGIKECEDIPIKDLVLLFATVLRHKASLDIDDDLYKKAWETLELKDLSSISVEEYSEVVVIIFEHVPNEDFETMVADLLNTTEKTIKERDSVAVRKYIKLWTSILSSSFNAVKVKQMQLALYRLLKSLNDFQKKDDLCSETILDINKFVVTLIRTVHLPFTSLMCDILLIYPTSLLLNETNNFEDHYNAAMNILMTLVKYRKTSMLDRLPVFLQGYTVSLRKLCLHGNSDANISVDRSYTISDCAYNLEKLTNTLVTNKKDMTRISCFLIAEILKQYEQITLFPNVKKHLNNCVYSLISLCDQHSVSYLMRSLSTASTEMFKILYEQYKKYHKFTGKV